MHSICDYESPRLRAFVSFEISVVGSSSNSPLVFQLIVKGAQKGGSGLGAAVCFESERFFHIPVVQGEEECIDQIILAFALELMLKSTLLEEYREWVEGCHDDAAQASIKEGC